MAEKKDDERTKLEKEFASGMAVDGLKLGIETLSKHTKTLEELVELAGRTEKVINAFGQALDVMGSELPYPSVGTDQNIAKLLIVAQIYHDRTALLAGKNDLWWHEIAKSNYLHYPSNVMALERLVRYRSGLSDLQGGLRSLKMAVTALYVGVVGTDIITALLKRVLRVMLSTDIIGTKIDRDNAVASFNYSIRDIDDIMARLDAIIKQMRSDNIELKPVWDKLVSQNPGLKAVDGTSPGKGTNLGHGPGELLKRVMEVKQ